MAGKARNRLHRETPYQCYIWKGNGAKERCTSRNINESKATRIPQLFIFKFFLRGIAITKLKFYSRKCNEIRWRKSRLKYTCWWRNAMSATTTIYAIITFRIQSLNCASRRAVQVIQLIQWPRDFPVCLLYRKSWKFVKKKISPKCLNFSSITSFFCVSIQGKCWFVDSYIKQKQKKIYLKIRKTQRLDLPKIDINLIHCATSANIYMYVYILHMYLHSKVVHSYTVARFSN